VEVTDKDKHSSLLQQRINYSSKMFYETGPGLQAKVCHQGWKRYFICFYNILQENRKRGRRGTFGEKNR